MYVTQKTSSPTATHRTLDPMTREDLLSQVVPPARDAEPVVTRSHGQSVFDDVIVADATHHVLGVA